LAAILDEAVEDDHIPVNPAREKRMKVKVPKPRRTFLERDELWAVLDAAAEQDRPLANVKLAELGPTATLVAHLLAQGKRPKQIATALGVNTSTVSWHLSHMGANVGRGYVGRRVICEILGRSGVRVSELCDLRIGQARVHDPDGARFKILDAKTESGVRDVEMTPDLVEVVIEHIDQLRRAGHQTGPSDPLVPNLNGGRISRQRVGKILREAARAASDQRVAMGLPPLPAVTPHSMRRTYISLALVANNFDVKWVMRQVGHANSKMTLDVYAQLEQRIKRDHGASLDRLISSARVQTDGTTAPAESTALAMV
jgi:integrase